MIYDIIIIGAGASGLAAAYQGIRSNPQLKILVLEKESIPGRKLSAAGNGKCNLTNSDFREECYHSDNPKFIKNWTTGHTPQEISDFFEDLGILLYQNHGYFYPMSNQGKQVTNLLVEKSQYLGVQFHLNTRAFEIRALDGKQPIYEIKAMTKEGKECSFQARYVILSTGGKAAPKLGGCEDGYVLGRQLRLKERICYPVLSPIYVEDQALSLVKGVRLDAVVTLKKDNFCVKEAGQVQFNEKSLSGIVIMNLSCYLNSRSKEDWNECLFIDTLPKLSWDRLKQFLIQQKEAYPNELLALILSGILPNAFGKYIMKRLHYEQSVTMSDLTEKQLNRLCSNLKKMSFTPVFYEDFDKGQVTGGGIATEEVDVDTFESKKYRNLYITGEVLDVNGICGGYNLTFAVLSGIQAIKHIIK